jgi:hypothetical protein
VVVTNLLLMAAPKTNQRHTYKHLDIHVIMRSALSLPYIPLFCESTLDETQKNSLETLQVHLVNNSTKQYLLLA